MVEVKKQRSPLDLSINKQFPLDTSLNQKQQREEFERKVIEEKRNEEDDLFKRESLELKFEHQLEDLREKIFHEEGKVLFDDGSLKKSVTDESSSGSSLVEPPVPSSQKLISNNLPSDLATNRDVYYGYEFPLPEEIVAETLYRWYCSFKQWFYSSSS